MGVEIERKFLLCDASWRAQVERSERMLQGYLGGDAASVRVRIEGEVAWLNIKSRELGAKRLEFEYAIPLADAEILLARLCGEQVSKRRHIVRHGGKTWEIDEFFGDNAGLVVAEIELEHEHEDFARPGWLGAEVTDDARFYNVNLARVPFARWPDRAAFSSPYPMLGE
jgi:adenylate cyclase